MAASTRSSGSTRTATRSAPSRCRPIPAANLNTATFDGRGVLWFTGQAGMYGRLDPDVGKVEAFAAPRGAGPYGIATTPDGRSGTRRSPAAIRPHRPGDRRSQVVEPADARAGRAPRLVGPDGPAVHQRVERGPGRHARPGDGRGASGACRATAHAVRGLRRRRGTSPGSPTSAANAIVRFDPATETFTSIPLPTAGRRGPPAARPPGRGVGRRVGDRQAGRRADLTAQPAADPGRTMPTS